MVTVVLTSCGRIDLLKRTVDSFMKYNTHYIDEYVLIDDSCDGKIHGKIRRMLPDWTLILDKVHRGQSACIDEAYSRVNTPFIFHMEDDWEFYREGFIERSMDVLNYEPKVITVWLRELDDTNGHPVETEIIHITGHGTYYNFVANNYRGIWHGFTLNPGLRRLSDYNLIKPYAKFGIDKGATLKEHLIGGAYHKLGFRGVILSEGYVKHIGQLNSTKKNESK